MYSDDLLIVQAKIILTKFFSPKYNFPPKNKNYPDNPKADFQFHHSKMHSQKDWASVSHRCQSSDRDG